MTEPLPGDKLEMEKMPGHWALAQLGKRVLRPGGLGLTRKMLARLNIGPDDRVVEYAPGMGITARITLTKRPMSYTAVERDEAAARQVRQYLTSPNHSCKLGSAEDTGLEDGSASVVYGEAMLTMQPVEIKARIVQEAARVLEPGGRYGMHEICLVDEELDDETILSMEKDMAQAIRVGVRPLKRSEWRKLLEDHGLHVIEEAVTDFHLLEPGRILRDEGLFGAIRFAVGMLRNPAARTRVLTMRRTIRKYSHLMKAIMLIGVKGNPT